MLPLRRPGHEHGRRNHPLCDRQVVFKSRGIDFSTVGILARYAGVRVQSVMPASRVRVQPTERRSSIVLTKLST